MKIKHLSNECGIYIIFCKTNSKVYIGSSLSVKARGYRHRRDLEKNIHSNLHLQNAWNLFGSNNFEIEIIEKCSEEERIDKEQYYLDKLKSYDKTIGFNIQKKADSPRGITRSIETKNKISEALIDHQCLEETKRRIGDGNRGKIMSEGSIEKIRLSKIGLKQSEENIAKRARHYSFIDSEGNIFIGKNLKRFCEKYGLSRSCMRLVLQGKRKRHQNFRLCT